MRMGHVRAAWALGLALASGYAVFAGGATGCKQDLKCDDGVKNGDETDIDCGGGCPQCATFKQCAENSDCVDDVCANEICQDSCNDGLYNGSESDVDCGGSCPDRCAPGDMCEHDFECASGVCVLGTCGDFCINGVKDVAEPDVDCGAACPKRCAEGKPCFSTDDCQADLCSGGVCTSCFHEYCAIYISEFMPGPWCEELPDFPLGMTSPSYTLYSAFWTCVCGDPKNPALGGLCKDACKDEACAGEQVVTGGPCQDCIVNQDSGCGKQFNDCANDF